jgi:acetolactate synthase-1/2/3 large subunit
MIKVSDYIANFISKIGVKHVFTVSGAGDLHLLDSIKKSKHLKYICNHHEQASAMAAYSYARATKNIGVCIVTTGPGATNAITGMLDCWVDSVPGLYISGQVQRKYMIGTANVRQNGIQEINIIDMVKPVTKYAVVIDDPYKIKYCLQKALHLAKSGRPGPVWLDIPMDIQSSIIDEKKLEDYIPVKETKTNKIEQSQIKRIIGLIKNSKRPILLFGHGVKAADAEELSKKLINLWHSPICLGWNALDLIPSNYKRYVGRFGTYGQRGANFAVQNSDLLISIGSRLNITQTGYVYSEFARDAKKVYVDIDPNELLKHPIKPDESVCCDAKLFLEKLILYLKKEDLSHINSNVENWVKLTQTWKNKYPVALPEYSKNKKYLNSFTLIDLLTKSLNEGDIIIPTASGSGFTSFHQAANVKNKQIIFTSNGFAEMGFDIPGAIGAAVATNKKVWQTTGDGGIQMNIQELQTLKHYNLPVKIFIHSNEGYLTIRHTQNGLFNGSYSGSSSESGVTLPNFKKLTSAYGIPFFKIKNVKEFNSVIEKIKKIDGPTICEVIMDPEQPLIPKTSFKILPDGRLVSPPIEDLYPYLDREEFKENMIVKTIDY